MTEEEKKAIEYWKRDIKLYHYNTQLASEHYAQIVLNLIEKQEKVIQGLNKQADELVNDYEKQLQEKNEYIFRLESERDRWE